MALFGHRAVGKFGLVITGLNEMRRKIRPGGEVERKVQAGLVRAMIENVEDLLGRSMHDAPVKEGTLRASGSAAVLVDGRQVARRGTGVAEGSGRGVVGIVGFNAPHALVQHERLDFHHPKGGKAKYLEDNLKQRATAYADNMGDHVAGALA